MLRALFITGALTWAVVVGCSAPADPRSSTADIVHSVLSNDERAGIVQTVADISDQLRKAAETGNIDEALRFYSGADDFSYVTNGKVYNSRETFEQLLRNSYGERRNMSMDIDSRHISVVSPDIVILCDNGRVTITLKDARSFSARYASGSVYRREGSEWRIIHMHEFVVP